MNLFYVLADVSKPIGERTVEALQDTLIGMLVVFLALSVLWAIIEIFHAVVSRATGKSKMLDSTPTEQTSAPATVIPEAQPDEDDAAIVAAITAAISLSIDAPVGSFRVVSFKRSGSNAHWNKN